MADPRPNPRFIVSEFADDPDMRELVAMFLDEMPDRIGMIEAASREGRVGDLRRLAHQLKGAAGGYGFGVVGEAAGRLEEALTAEASGSEPSADLVAIRAQVEELLDMCRSVRARASG
ncbi:MAG: Hpt domain-containing protein [Phycisphaeraceae bacterium]|nr:Hpt domain-containing protein [Phycisphaerae bacterium]MBX3393499.1 Hpt domain-containing protein [Phycisphaeraceae bacterium]HRJ49439.1 Hpt domain-containing protein [Phycisphaerales bacterium]